MNDVVVTVNFPVAVTSFIVHGPFDIYICEAGKPFLAAIDERSYVLAADAKSAARNQDRGPCGNAG